MFVELNPSEKHREKQCFLILSSWSHNLTGKLIFSLKKVIKASNLIAPCLWCFQMLIMMLSNYTLDALLHGQSIKSVEIERPILITKSIQKIDIVRNLNVILGVLDALN